MTHIEHRILRVKKSIKLVIIYPWIGFIAVTHHHLWFVDRNQENLKTKRQVLSKYMVGILPRFIVGVIIYRTALHLDVFVNHDCAASLLSLSEGIL